MAKKFIITVLFQLLLTLSFTASAHSHHGGCGGCGCDPDPGCEQSGVYSETFTTDIFTKDTFFNKYNFGFDPVTPVGTEFEITSATLTVTTNSNGFLDKLYAEDHHFWNFVGFLNNGATQVFDLDSSLFDEILDGISFKAWFSQSTESITLAELTVNGKYCLPPSAVPVPAAVWLFGSAFVGLIGFGKRGKNQV